MDAFKIGLKHVHVPAPASSGCARRGLRSRRTRPSVYPKALGTTPEFWLNLQTYCDLLVNQAADIEEIKPLLTA
jgi:hypothetical protein